MGWKRKLGSSLALLHLGCRWQPAPAAVIGSKSSDQVRGGPRINSSSAAFSQSRAVLGSRGGGRTKLGGLPAKQAVLQRPSLRRRHREGHRRGQCLMGVKGLTSYVDQNLRAAAPIEHLREVRTRVRECQVEQYSSSTSSGGCPTTATRLSYASEMLLSISGRQLNHYGLG